MKAPTPSYFTEISGMAAAVLVRARRGAPARKTPELRGDQPVLVLPGYATSDSWTWWMRRELRALGHDARGWGLGVNHGRVRELLPPLMERLSAFQAEAGRPVSLVGWSLGGLLARMLAREQPGSVARVISLGSPVQGGPKYTSVAAAYEQRGFDLDELEQKVAEANQTPIPVPLTSVYTRRDTIVSWEACIDPWNAHAEHHEVNTSHAGLILCPETLDIVARALVDGPG